MSQNVMEWYNQWNNNCNWKCKVNEWDMPSQVNQYIKQLNPETMKRYYGSGFIVPEYIQGMKILDVGCGSGSNVFLLSKMVGSSGQVVGIDFTQSQIDCCNQQIDYHMKQWGYSSPNVEFHCCNAENMMDYNFGQFDVIISNGSFCLFPNKSKAWHCVYQMLKPGGMFYYSDVFCNQEQPSNLQNDKNFWCWMLSGSMMWNQVAQYASKEGFTSPYLYQCAPVQFKNSQMKQQCNNCEYMCCAWKMFKLPSGASKQASQVTYLGNMENYSSCFPWDMDTWFQKGQAVNCDAYLSTILANTNCYKNCFSFSSGSSSCSNPNMQDPWKKYQQMQTVQGKTPSWIYQVE